MARSDWGALQSQFLTAHATTGIKAKEWCETQGLNYGTAKRYIKIANCELRAGDSQKNANGIANLRMETANETANSQTENELKAPKSKGSNEESKREGASHERQICDPPEKTKRHPNSKGKPFEINNTASLKHGGYSRRVLLPDDVIEDARDLTLYDELLRIRANNLLAASTIGRARAALEDADKDERPSLLEQIEAADKAMMRNTARIESLERTLSQIHLNMFMPQKMEADIEGRRAATEKLKVEIENLRRGDDGKEVIVVHNVLPMPGSVE